MPIDHLLGSESDTDAADSIEEWVADHCKRLNTAFRLADDRTTKKTKERQARHNAVADADRTSCACTGSNIKRETQNTGQVAVHSVSSDPHEESRLHIWYQTFSVRTAHAPEFMNLSSIGARSHGII